MVLSENLLTLCRIWREVFCFEPFKHNLYYQSFRRNKAVISILT